MIAINSPLSVNVTELSHRYDKYLAVDRISFQIAAGQTFGLIGPNGAGKSTTIKMLTTLLPITSGNAYINGFSVIDDPVAIRRNIGYVPQSISADGELTGYENLLQSARLYGLTPSYQQKRIDEVLNLMKLTEYKQQLVNTYSGGMIRRLEIALAFLHHPHVLFLDEPTLGLDPAARKHIWKHIRELTRTKNMTILMTTHDMEEADTLCDIVALMYRGKIVIMDTPANLKSAIGANATLDDVFIKYTGGSLKNE